MCNRSEIHAVQLTDCCANRRRVQLLMLADIDDGRGEARIVKPSSAVGLMIFFHSRFAYVTSMSSIFALVFRAQWWLALLPTLSPPISHSTLSRHIAQAYGPRGSVSLAARHDLFAEHRHEQF